MKKTLLEVKNLKKYFPIRSGFFSKISIFFVENVQKTYFEISKSCIFRVKNDCFDIFRLLPRFSAGPNCQTGPKLTISMFFEKLNFCGNLRQNRVF